MASSLADRPLAGAKRVKWAHVIPAFNTPHSVGFPL